MSRGRNRNEWTDPLIADYVAAHTTPPDEIQEALIDETASHPYAQMQISADQGVLMALLVQLVDARFVVEIGTFTGYSSLAIARALPPGGRLLCCDVSEEFTSIARRYWERAGVSDRIELRIAPALETLRSLPDDTVIDLAFIDADKTSYRAYYEELLSRLKVNGLILIDNTLWSGHVARDELQDANTVALRELNDVIAADPRVDSYILPISDGLTIVRKR
jgi:caffeoyl-CoA O-methyltransferase